MSLEGLVKEIEDARKMEQARWMALMREQHESTIRAKDEEIAALKDEIETLRSWLDHSALPAANPISKRPEALGLIKLNFGKDKPPPEMWMLGEKELLDSVERKSPDKITDEELEEAESLGVRPPEVPETILPEPEPTESHEVKLPGPKPSESPEPEPSEPQEASLPEPEPHEAGKTETPRPVKAARKISRLRGSRTRRAKRPRSRPGKKAR